MGNYPQAVKSFIFEEFNDPTFWVYDLETFPNIFTGVFTNIKTGELRVYEISDRVSHLTTLLEFLNSCRQSQTFVGFNNLGFDYPILHMIMTLGQQCRLEDIWDKSQEIINSPWSDRYSHIIKWPHIKQIDLMRVMRFDDDEESTGLKMLECRMNMQSVQDLPFPPGTILSNEQCNELIKYNIHDVTATLWFFFKILPEIILRFELSNKYDIDFTNDSNTKIGARIFEKTLNERNIKCDPYTNTSRDFVKLKECILPYIQFKNPEFNRIKQYFESQTITETKGVFKNLNAEVNGVKYVYGLGGLHASVKRKSFFATDEMVIRDSDAKSFYPHVSFLNDLFPEHLGPGFCKVYEELYIERSGYKKGSSFNLGLKEALNSIFGKTLAKYGSFKDTKTGMSMTISGQLSLCMFIENLLLIPGLEIISANTDGVCYIHPKSKTQLVDQVCRWWEQVTNSQQLSHTYYSKVFQRDVNNYIAVEESGEVKRKGCYGYGKDLTWGKNHSMQIVSKSAEKWLLSGGKDKILITNHSLLFDFIIHLKVPRNAILVIGEKIVPNIIRYVITNDGEHLNKIMPPKGIEGEFKRANSLTNGFFDSVMDEIGFGIWDERIHTKNKSVYAERRSDINKGHKVTLVTDLKDLHTLDINYDFYINETNKITENLI